MTESAKLRRLKTIREQLSTGKLSEVDQKTGVIFDTDGREVRLSEDGALAALDRRIAAEEGIA